MSAIESLPSFDIFDPTDWYPFSPKPERRAFVDVGDARLHVVESGEGPPWLFLHGSPLWSFTWRHALHALDGRRIAVDLPGLGSSTAPLSRSPYARNAQVFADFVRQYDLSDLVVVAHATAGPSAIGMAAELRERLRGLVLINTFAWDLFESPLGRMARMVSSWPFRTINRLTNLLPLLTARFGRRTGPFTPAERQAWLAAYRRPSPRAHLSALLGGLRWERRWLADLESSALAALSGLPALLIFGAHDNGHRAGHGARLRRVLAGADLVVLEDSGHFPTEDEPERVCRVLADWGQRLPRGLRAEQ